MVKITSFVFLIIFLSCGKGKLLTTPDYARNPSPVDTTRLRFDGFYSIVDSKYPYSEYTAVDEVIFTKDNRIYNAFGASTSNVVFTCDRYRLIDKNRLGAFIISENKIKAFVPTIVTIGDGASYLQYNLNYEGIIQTRELIIGWHAIPPFPEKFGKNIINSFQNQHIFEPQTIRFVQTNAVECLKTK